MLSLLKGGLVAVATLCLLAAVHVARLPGAVPPQPPPPHPTPPTLNSTTLVAVLLSNDEYRWDMLRSLCENVTWPHPFAFLVDPAMVDLAEADKPRVAGMLQSNDCRVRREVHWIDIPGAVWEGGAPSTSSSWRIGYRRMSWFWSRGVFHITALQGVRYLIRLDTDSAIASVAVDDPVKQLQEANAGYGYAAFCYDLPSVADGLWYHTLRYAEQNNLSISDGAQGGYLLPEACGAVRTTCSIPHPMFFTNFEVLDLSVFRSRPVDAFVRSCFKGVFGLLDYSTRWGDAPIRAATVALFNISTVHITSFDYVHGRSIGRQVIPSHNDLNASWEAWRDGNWTDPYFRGQCFKRPAPAATRPLLISKRRVWKRLPRELLHPR